MFKRFSNLAIAALTAGYSKSLASCVSSSQELQEFRSCRMSADVFNAALS